MKEININATSVNTNIHDSPIKENHEGVRYEYDQCECKDIWQSYQTNNIKSKHEEVRYECDQCEYKASDKVSKCKHKVSEYKSSDKVSKHKTWMSYIWMW